ncbi:hypothetical protein [Rubinisphaera margarita]|uniref:hypothetical protein n=1 Tax=Rubinisphaera margarita TaxID=2909586 RepID=UPI001EE96EF5|nr:hypothetical protein [Rubinisphaera margarita]MCG6158109.1 hypothetical protein [Rubinisphaera margarita]
MEHWLDWSESAGRLHELMVGDSNGDGLSDIFARSADGWWHAAESTGSSFVDRPLAEWYAALDWRYVHIGSFAVTLPLPANATTPESIVPRSPSALTSTDDTTSLVTRWAGNPSIPAKSLLTAESMPLQTLSSEEGEWRESDYDEFSRVDLLQYLDGIRR